MFDFKYDRAAVISALGIESSDDDFKVHVLSRIDELLDTRVGMIVQDALSDEEALELQKLGDDRAAASEFLAKRFPNHNEMYKQELQQIVSELKVALG